LHQGGDVWLFLAAAWHEPGRVIGEAAVSVGVILAVVVVVLGAVRHLGELVIRSQAQVRIEENRHAVLLHMLVAAPPGSFVVQQHPDGTACTFVRGPGAALPTSWTVIR